MPALIILIKRYAGRGYRASWRSLIGDNMMKRFILILALLAVALSGCTEKAPSPGELKNMMVHSAANLSSYSFALSDNHSESIKDLVKNNITNTNNVTTRFAKNDVVAAVDLVGQKAMAKIATATVMTRPGGQPNTVSTMGLEYDIGNATYITRDGSNWTQLRDNQSAEAVWASGRYSVIKSRADSVNKSKAELAGSESIDGKDCYKLKLIDSNQTYLSTAYSALTSVLFPFYPEVNQTDLIKASKSDTFVWIEKDSNQLRKYESTLSMKIAPNIVGIVNMNTGAVQRLNKTLKLVEISIDKDSIETYSDYNKPVSIVVPKEALNATPITPQSIQVVPGSNSASP
jgi:hypothetical protein